MVECSYLHGVWPTLPGPSYTREFGYNEEAQLLSISHSGTLAYQYAYGADGNRRWAKDIANNAWSWYPCGVACGAGELVEQGSDLTGTTWTTNAQYLRAGGGCSSMLIRRRSITDDEYQHEYLLGVFGAITGAAGAVLSSNVYDAFMGMQYKQGVSKTTQPAICYKALSEPSILTGSGGRGVVVPIRCFQELGNRRPSVKMPPQTAVQCGSQIVLDCCLETHTAYCLGVRSLLRTSVQCALCPNDTTGLVGTPVTSVPNMMISHFIPAISTE